MASTDLVLVRSGLSVSPSSPGGAAPPACWNTAGVYGNGTCQELARFIHCRNCPVYSAAGVQLLNRALPADYRQESTKHFSTERKPRPTALVSAVLFRLGEEWLALPTRIFQEVAEHRYIHSLPHRRQGLVLGLANVRGELLICVSLAHLLNLDARTPTPILANRYDRLIVVHWEGSRFGFPVDEVRGPHRFHPDELKNAPATVAKSNPTFIEHILYWSERSAGLLDADAVFSALNGRLA
jgi:chemotaxis-related protein WspD